VSKTRQRNHSELDHLRGRVKKLESQNRQLRRRLKSLDKREHLYEDLLETISEDIVIEPKCPQCKSKIEYKDFTHVKYEVCVDCDYKKKL
jgi:predicted RNase H-like nuclease (RuvC/YqgF family)